MKKLFLRTGAAALVLALLALLPVQVRARELLRETGGISVLKTDLSGNGLPGAQYRIFRQADPWELTDSAIVKELVKVEGEYRTMVEVSFWTEPECAGAPQWKLVTDDTGKARAYGLSFGEYCLLEDRAPAGYQRMAEPVAVKVNRYSHAMKEDGIYDEAGRVVDNTVQIITIRYRLPEQLVNSSVLLVSGGAVLLSAAALLLLNRGRREYAGSR